MWALPHLPLLLLSPTSLPARAHFLPLREYIACGKGRDMGFDSINGFEMKLSGGCGAVLVSRDLWRFCARLDVFRLLHFYYRCEGYGPTLWGRMAGMWKLRRHASQQGPVALLRASGRLLPAALYYKCEGCGGVWGGGSVGICGTSCMFQHLPPAALFRQV